MEGTIADVRCPNCGAPAHYDIIRQNFLCGSCGSRVEVSEAAAQKQGFRSMQQEKIRSSAKQYRLMRAACSGGILPCRVTVPLRSFCRSSDTGNT